MAITKVNHPGRSKHYEFQPGKLDSAYSPSNPTDVLIAYEAQLAKYPYLEHGFDVPYSVSSDLLLPFGELTKKYELQATVDLNFGFTEGLGDVLAHPTLYVMKLFGPTLIKELSTGFLTTALHDNSLLYEHARADLGQNALLNSSILVVDRNCRRGAKVLVKSPSGADIHQSSEVNLYDSAQAGQSSWTGFERI